MPVGGKAPEAMVSAKKGDVLYFDSGLRSNRSVDPAASEPAFLGSWYSSSCLERAYTRGLVMYPNGTFTASDLVSPCPKGAQCIWSGIVTRAGTWQLDRGMIELTMTAESRPGTGAPLADLLEWHPTEDKLVEMVVGGPMTCEYQRQRPVEPRPEPGPEPSPEPRELNTCEAAVQDTIAWNYQGSTRWAFGNLQRLCAGAESSTEPAACFNETMHGGLPGKTNTRWHWQDALKLCAGSTDAQKTLGCYRAEYHMGSSSEAAVEVCRSTARQAPSDET